jgi:alanine dehydrogenase
MPLYLTEDDVAELVSMGDVIERLDEALATWGDPTTVNLPRQRVALEPGALNVMPAAHGAYFGLKSYAAAPGGGTYHVLLYSRSETRLLALIEANVLSQLRTGAASGVATRHLARAGARTLGQIGAGKQAAAQIRAVCAVRPIERIRVYSRDPARRAAFAKQMSEELGVDVVAAPNPRECVDGADVVTTITRSAEPVLLGDWVAGGTHVNLAGANALDRREADEALLERADGIVVDDQAQAKIEAAEFAAAVAAGKLDWSEVVELGDVVAGRVPVRERDEDVTVFKSLGVALEDVATAALVYERACAAGRGRSF